MNLIEKYKGDNELDIEKIILDYSNYVIRIIKNTSNVLTDEDIEEIVIDVFLVIWNNKEKLEEDKNIEPYIISITKNLMKTKYRKLKLDLNVEDYEEHITSNYNIEEVIEQKEKNKIIENALVNMEQKDKNIFILFYYNSKSIKEIAKQLNLSDINVKTRLHRIRKKIKNFLVKGGYSYNE